MEVSEKMEKRDENRKTAEKRVKHAYLPTFKIDNFMEFDIAFLHDMV